MTLNSKMTEILTKTNSYSLEDLSYLRGLRLSKIKQNNPRREITNSIFRKRDAEDMRTSIKIFDKDLRVYHNYCSKIESFTTGWEHSRFISDCLMTDIITLITSFNDIIKVLINEEIPMPYDICPLISFRSRKRIALYLEEELIPSVEGVLSNLLKNNCYDKDLKILKTNLDEIYKISIASVLVCNHSNCSSFQSQKFDKNIQNPLENNLKKNVVQKKTKCMKKKKCVKKNVVQKNVVQKKTKCDILKTLVEVCKDIRKQEIGVFSIESLLD